MPPERGRVKKEVSLTCGKDSCTLIPARHFPSGSARVGFLPRGSFLGEFSLTAHKNHSRTICISNNI